jgi:hypothetical protein
MELLDPHNVQEVLCDGTDEVRIIEDKARTVFFSRQDGIGIVVARLAFPVSVLPDVIQALVAALARAPRTTS